MASDITQTQNTDTLISVEQLLARSEQNIPANHFFIPAYQRGYRWSATHAARLVEDLLEFKKYLEDNGGKDKKDAFYCLQALVTIDVDDKKYPDYKGYTEVIDGQQRLTTMLLMLQAIHALIKRKDIDSDQVEVTLFPRRYFIKYETRHESDVWLEKLKSVISVDDEKARSLIDDNCDYCHLVEAYLSIYERLDAMTIEDLMDFRRMIYKHVKFIPYSPITSSDSNNDIFDDINAGRIDLNNAELVKALLVQESNLGGKKELEHHLDAIALEWDAVERRLHDKEFWGFIFSSKHPFDYDTHIEYLLNLITNKTESDADYEYYTFDKINDRYKEATDKLKFAKDTWQEIKTIFDTLEEWYTRRDLYHRIGYLLEFGKDDNKKPLTIITIKNELMGKKKDEQINYLDNMIIKSLENVKSESLFYSKPELTQVLYLFNILAENQRISTTARFSFADYKNITRTHNGWDQEHVASNNDFTLKQGEHQAFARDMIEYFTGISVPKDETVTMPKEQLAENIGDSDLADKLLEAANADKKSYSDEKTKQLFADVFDYFDKDNDTSSEIAFNDNSALKAGNRAASEKNFIWNFVLLNAGTNRSYGNALFPVKRKRILLDEYKVYTPVGTRNVFEKSYSRKLLNMMSWTRDDAKAYWQEICRVLSPYKTFEFPFKNF